MELIQMLQKTNVTFGEADFVGVVNWNAYSLARGKYPDVFRRVHIKHEL